MEPRWELVADRIRDEATDDWDDQVAVDRLTGKGARFVRGHGSIEGARPSDGVQVSIDGDDLDGHQGRRGQHRDHAGDPTGRGHRRRRLLDEPRLRRGPRAAGLADRARRRRDRLRAVPGGGPVRRAGSRWWSGRPGCSRWRTGRAGELVADRLRGGRDRRPGRGRRHPRRAARRRWRRPGAARGRHRADRGPAAGRQRAARSTCTRSGWTPWASTPTPAPSRSTSGAGSPTACGRSATSSGTARSPTCRCTRPTSSSATSWVRAVRRPATTRSRG